MAVTVVVLRQGRYSMEASVIASADGDVAAVVPHGLGVAPSKVSLRPVLPNFYTSTWTVGVIDAVNVNLVKANAVGSGNAGVQVVCEAEAPHSEIA